MAAHAADSTSFNPVSVQASAQSGAVPVGAIVAWPVATNPPNAANWLECNGQSTSVYPELRAVIGGAVPDLRGKFLRDLGGNSAGLGATQGDAIRNISGSVGGTLQGAFIGETASGAFHSNEKWDAWTGSDSDIFARGVEFSASNQVPTANENRPVNMAVRYLIRARP